MNLQPPRGIRQIFCFNDFDKEYFASATSTSTSTSGLARGGRAQEVPCRGAPSQPAISLQIREFAWRFGVQLIECLGK
jgi:hypothetical protein